jgi:hypothetical protein
MKGQKSHSIFGILRDFTRCTSPVVVVAMLKAVESPGPTRLLGRSPCYLRKGGRHVPFDRAVDTRRVYRWKFDLCAVHMMCAGEGKLLVAWVHSET